MSAKLKRHNQSCIRLELGANAAFAKRIKKKRSRQDRSRNLRLQLGHGDVELMGTFRNPGKAAQGRLIFLKHRAMFLEQCMSATARMEDVEQIVR